MTDSTENRDYWPMVRSMVAADFGSLGELVLRYTVVFLAAIFMTLQSGNALIAVWLSGFLIVNGYYSWRLARIRGPVSYGPFISLNALLMASVAIYTSCAVYIFGIGTVPFKSLAVAALVAQAVFNLSRHRYGSPSAIFDTIVVALAGLHFGFSSINLAEKTLAEVMVITVSTIGVSSYYVVAQYRNIQTHRSLRRARAEAIQTQKMQAVGQITAGVAHDFNNLLTVIRGNIELAEHMDSRAEMLSTLNDAKAAADRAAKLTSQLLSFSRKARLEATTVTMATFWDEFASILQRGVPASIQVDVSVSKDLRHLYCDSTQLQNALLNLLINARDALGGRGDIALFSRPATAAEIKGIRRKGDTFGAIGISDNGPGIAAELLGSVTDPFFTTKAVGEGSGLGLSMVKGFTEQSGGGLLISSAPGGTRVTMILPTEPGLVG